MNKLKFSLIIFIWVMVSCFSKKEIGVEALDEQKAFRLRSDDSLLTVDQLPRIMPYNRIVKSAGQEWVFGDPNFENHSLDCKLLSDHKTLVVEDRYGIILYNKDTQRVLARFTYSDDPKGKYFTSTFSGIKVREESGRSLIYWSAATGAERHGSAVMVAQWDGNQLILKSRIDFEPKAPSPLALPNEIELSMEGSKHYLYVVLNGNNQLVKIDLETEKPVWSVSTGVAPYGICQFQGQIYISNWGGREPLDTLQQETAGVPYGKAFIDPKTGATNEGTVSSFQMETGKFISEVRVGLHPNAIVKDSKRNLLYVSCGNSDRIYVLNPYSLKVLDSVSVKLDGSKLGNSYIGDSPNALLIDSVGDRLFVSNGMDNALAVFHIGYPSILSETNSFSPNSRMELQGFIPTGAYPAGMDMTQNSIFVCNLEGSGAWADSRSLKSEKKNVDPEMKRSNSVSYNAHHQLASISIIPIPGSQNELDLNTEQVKRNNLVFRADLSRLLPRERKPVPVPLRVGEPSVFQHVLYIIKENRTYDQVLGDMKEGRGDRSLCVFGDSITPNQHQIAQKFLLMDNFYASGKCSAEGHQWADEGMVSDYVEKNVRSWFRSYPHVQTDALVYTPTGFIWNDALDHGKSVRIYGEACVPKMDPKLSWKDVYDLTQKGEQFPFSNYSTISRVRPILSPNFPASDSHTINDIYRADAFIRELKAYEKQDGDALPNLMVMALSNDHTVGVRPGFPSPRAMVADNDLALGKIIEAVSHSRFYKNTVIFVMEDDSQSGWDHISGYRTTGFVISPYSRIQKTITTNYNQTSVVRTIEQILGIPPMNTMDATALPMFDCFQAKPNFLPFTLVKNKIPLDEMNKSLSQLKGKSLFWAKIANKSEYDHLDGGNDDEFNQMLWFTFKGNKPYPRSN